MTALNAAVLNVLECHIPATEQQRVCEAPVQGEQQQLDVSDYPTMLSVEGASDSEQSQWTVLTASGKS